MKGHLRCFILNKNPVRSQVSQSFGSPNKLSVRGGGGGREGRGGEGRQIEVKVNKPEI